MLQVDGEYSKVQLYIGLIAWGHDQAGCLWDRDLLSPAWWWWRAPVEAPSHKEVLLSKERGRSQLSQTFNHVVRFHLVTPGQQNKQSSNKVGIGKMNFDGKLIKLNVIAITTLCLFYEVYIVIICIANGIGGKKQFFPIREHLIDCRH